MHVRQLGLIPYREAWALQEELRAARAQGMIPDTLLLCEHPPVFTVGRQDCRADWRATFDTIARAGIEVIQVNRGGRITYHGPGQLVGYFIVDVRSSASGARISTSGAPGVGVSDSDPGAESSAIGRVRPVGIRDFVTAIEALLIRTLHRFGVVGTRDAQYPGVWVGTEKVAAIGLHVSRGITQHGFALNVTPRMDAYAYILPCGIPDRGVTSLARLLDGEAPSMEQVIAVVTAESHTTAGYTASNVGVSPFDSAAGSS